MWAGGAAGSAPVTNDAGVAAVSGTGGAKLAVSASWVTEVPVAGNGGEPAAPSYGGGGTGGMTGVTGSAGAAPASCTIEHQGQLVDCYEFGRGRTWCQDGKCVFCALFFFHDCNRDPSDGCEYRADDSACSDCESPCVAGEVCDVLTYGLPDGGAQLLPECVTP